MDEPTAYMDKQGNLYKSVTHPENYTPLYKRREWVGLTEEDRAEAWAKTKGDLFLRLPPFSLALEAKLKEKNT